MRLKKTEEGIIPEPPRILHIMSLSPNGLHEPDRSSLLGEGIPETFPKLYIEYMSQYFAIYDL